MPLRSLFASLGIALLWLASAFAQQTNLEQALQQEPAEQLAADARQQGDSTRGAILFHQLHMSCTKCHSVDGSANNLGPELTRWEEKPDDSYLVEALLEPSEKIRKGYGLISVQTADGKTLSGLLVEQTNEQLVLRDLSSGKTNTIAAEDIEAQVDTRRSPMPAGLTNGLANRQQFLDLLRYLQELRDGGLARARELQPSPALYALQLPEYESHVDHAGLIENLDQEAFKRGREIYQRLCINCHGTVDRPGSLPTSLRFASGKFKNGSDPYTMYQTLTRGFGLMVPQTWMVPQQKYDVIHYIRQTYLKPHNPAQHFDVNQPYLAGLPSGDTFGPAPVKYEPWVTMNYGPAMINTFEVGDDGSNFAYKGIATRLDSGPGGISRGKAFMIFDHDTLRMAAAWTGSGFIDWNGIHFNGRHQVHPHVAGKVHVANPTGPGWANPETDSFTDDQRVVGRDDRHYGPLPREWAKYRGLYRSGEKFVVSYTVGETEILERADAWRVAPPQQEQEKPADTVFTRTLNLGSRPQDLLMLVATAPQSQPQLTKLDNAVLWGAEGRQVTSPDKALFDGKAYAEIADGQSYNMTDSDFTVTAQIKTNSDGTILAKSAAKGKWVPDGKTFFIRNGRLGYDIGWVGQVVSGKRVNDNRRHRVALRWHAESGQVELFVDGKPVGRGKLRPKEAAPEQVLRLGYTSPNFPVSGKPFQGELHDVRFYQRLLTQEELSGKAKADKPQGDWPLEGKLQEGKVADASPAEQHADWIAAAGSSTPRSGMIAAGLEGDASDCEWVTRGPKLCLRIPAGQQPLNLRVWLTDVTDPRQQAEQLIASLPHEEKVEDLQRLTHGGPALWPQKLTTTAALGDDTQPLAVDYLTHPEENPWMAQMRFSGLDFYPEGDRAVVCSWDGDVWLIDGLDKLADADPARRQLTWQRIASGLFQPLGIKLVDGEIFVTCRDQLVRLHDLNGDQEIDFYECFNNDHQVTDHFHEFAMGLQVDRQGNFLYAKSARHALPALVPHHGTLLRVSSDGMRTEIVANGFRAANGVCLNPDGTFVVTDQEGHWNPKNRINWVTEGGFYGNMLGYHNVTDSSDEAMDLPLCWITNRFDRSPAELLWVPDDAWGPLGGSLLNLSYGYGKIFIVPHEEVEGQKQGGMCMLPIGQLPTGVMRGRFHPTDRQLYACGLVAWGSAQRQPGGLYRIRHTGAPAYLPTELHAKKEQLEITFSAPLAPEAAADPSNYRIKAWDLKRTANYGSKHYNERALKVTKATLDRDGQTVTLTVPKLAPTWGMEITCYLKSSDGKPIERVIHNSIYHLAE